WITNLSTGVKAGTRRCRGRASGAEQTEELLGVQAPVVRRALEDAHRELALFRVELENRLLDRALRHEAHDGDRFRLADAVRAVARLILGRRVPPRIEVDDRIGRREVEAGAARLQRDQEE